MTTSGEQARPGGPAGPRRRRGTGHELRALILRVTTELLSEQGDVDALTMRAVAGAAGVTTPSLYRHFASKEELAQAVITERFTEFTTTLDAAVRRAADQGGGPLERLTALAHAYATTGLAEPGHYRVLFSAAHAGQTGLGLGPDDPHPGAASFRALVDAVGECLPAAVDPHRRAELAVELWASLHGIVDLRITKPEMPWPQVGPLVERALGEVRAAAAGGRCSCSAGPATTAS